MLLLSTVLFLVIGTVLVLLVGSVLIVLLGTVSALLVGTVLVLLVKYCIVLVIGTVLVLLVGTLLLLFGAIFWIMLLEHHCISCAPLIDAVKYMSHLPSKSSCETEMVVRGFQQPFFISPPHALTPSTHTHTCTHTISLSHTHTHMYTHHLSLSHTHTLALSWSQTIHQARKSSCQRAGDAFLSQHTQPESSTAYPCHSLHAPFPRVSAYTGKRAFTIYSDRGFIALELTIRTHSFTVHLSIILILRHKYNSTVLPTHLIPL